MDLRELYEEITLINLAYGDVVQSIHLARYPGESDGESYILFNTADRRRYGQVLKFFNKNRHYPVWRGTLYPLWMEPQLKINLWRHSDIDQERFRRRMEEPLHADETVLESFLEALAHEMERVGYG
jgi:hypothetical protein